VLTDRQVPIFNHSLDTKIAFPSFLRDLNFRDNTRADFRLMTLNALLV